MSQLDPGSGYNPTPPFEPKHTAETEDDQAPGIELSQTQNFPLESGAHSVSRKKPQKKQTEEIREKAATVIQASQQAASLAAEPLRGERVLPENQHSESIALTTLPGRKSVSKKLPTPSPSATNKKATQHAKRSTPSKNLIERIIAIIRRKNAYRGLSTAKKAILDTLQKTLGKMQKPLDATKITQLKEAILDSAREDFDKASAIQEIIKDHYHMIVSHFGNPEDAARLVSAFCKASPKTADGKMDLDKFTKLWIPILAQVLVPKSALRERALQMLKSPEGSLLSILQELITKSLQSEQSHSLFEQFVQTLVDSGIEKEQAKEYLVSALFTYCGATIQNTQLSSDWRGWVSDKDNDLAETMMNARAGETIDSLQHLKSLLTPEVIRGVIVSLES